jgi:hypothetical protein
MPKFPSHLEPHHYIFIFAIIAAGAVIVGAFFQLLREEASSQEQKELLHKATLQLERTDSIFTSQNKVIEHQLETIKQLTGGDGIPKLKAVLRDVNVAGMYELRFWVENSDTYPVQNVEMHVHDPEFTPGGGMIYTLDEYDKLMTSSLKTPPLRISPFTLPSNSTRLVHQTAYKLKDNRGGYVIGIYWMKGSYDVSLNFQLNEYIPEPSIQVNINGEKLDDHKIEKYFEFKSEVTDNILQKKKMESLENFNKQYLK